MVIDINLYFKVGLTQEKGDIMKYCAALLGMVFMTVTDSYAETPEVHKELSIS